MTVSDADPAILIEAWRSRGHDRIDPVRFRQIEAMARRGAAHEGEARRIIDDKLGRLLRAYGETLDLKARNAQAAATAPELQPHLHGALAALVDRIGPKAPAIDDDTLAYFRITWSRLSAERSLSRSLATVPENAGPLNSQQLVHRSLTLMRDLSPEYLHRFMAYVDALLRLDHGVDAAASANSKTAQAAPPKKAARGKGR